VVLRASLGKFSALLTGDVDTEVEMRLAGEATSLSATVLKVAHHGAPSGTSSAFLDQVSPLLAILSVGAENRFGHPSFQVLARLDERQCQVLRTDQHGTIHLITDGETLWVKQSRP
jgi:competence protein ComEC